MAKGNVLSNEAKGNDSARVLLWRGLIYEDVVDVVVDVRANGSINDVYVVVRRVDSNGVSKSISPMPCISVYGLCLANSSVLCVCLLLVYDVNGGNMNIVFKEICLLIRIK